MISACTLTYLVDASFVDILQIELFSHVIIFFFTDLQPDNLPTKRIWSKKYPIRIQVGTRKPFSTEEATQKMAAQDDIPDEAESKANETDDDVMLDAKEQLDDDLGN